MTDEIKIDFTADVRKVIRGTDQVGDSLDDTSKKLDDLGDDGARSLDKLTEAEEETERGAKDLGGTVAGELSDAFREFDGTAEGAVQGASSALSGLAALVPGIGALIGAGLGTVVSGFVGLWQQGAKDTEDRIRTMYDDMTESGNRFLSESFIQQAISNILNDAGKLETVKKLAEDAGIAVDDILAAEAGSKTALEDVLARVNAEIETNVALQADGTFESQEQLVAVENLLVKLQGVRDHFAGVTAEQGVAADKARLFDEAVDASKGNIAASNELLQIRNRIIATTTPSVTTRLVVDDSDLTDKLARSRTVRVNIEGWARNGQRVV